MDTHLWTLALNLYVIECCLISGSAHVCLYYYFAIYCDTSKYKTGKHSLVTNRHAHHYTMHVNFIVLLCIETFVYQLVFAEIKM